MKNLEDIIYEYALKLQKRFDFPAYVSGAEYKTIKKLGKSGGVNASDIAPIFVNLIESKKFGKIGEKYGKSTIGFCAEQVAANKIIRKHPHTISKIMVGSAIRPKTLQYRKKCIICNSLF